MENCLPRAGAGPDKARKTAIVGLGNPTHGDDGVGPVVARQVCDLLRGKADVDLLEHATSAFGLVERLVGYQRAVIVDALTGVQAEVGTVHQVEIQEPSSSSFLSFHTADFHDILTLARMVGLEVPSTIVMYGIAIKEPETFSENLSAELTAKLPLIVKAVAAEELLEYGKAPGADKWGRISDYGSPKSQDESSTGRANQVPGAAGGETSMETLAGVLSENRFFSEFPERYLGLIVGCASNVRFDEGQYLFREGDEANTFYLIRQGRVALQVFSERRGALTVQTLGEGEIVGWSWLFPPYRWKFTARTLEPTRAFAFDGQCLRAKAEEDRDLGYELLKRFSQVIAARLQATRLQLVNVYQDR